MLTITILYDNHAFVKSLTTKWGFSALVELQGKTLLFDTGGDGPTLLGNMDNLNVKPGKIETVILSHQVLGK